VYDRVASNHNPSERLDPPLWGENPHFCSGSDIFLSEDGLQYPGDRNRKLPNLEENLRTSFSDGVSDDGVGTVTVHEPPALEGAGTANSTLGSPEVLHEESSGSWGPEILQVFLAHPQELEIWVVHQTSTEHF
jgi:hypothetical protein